MTLLSILNEFPPPVVRMSARSGRGKPMTLKDIAQNSGLSLALVTWISERTSWASVDVWMVDDFLRGCGYEFSDRSKLRKYIRRTSKSKDRPFSHLSSKKLTKRQLAAIARNAERAASCQGGPSATCSYPA
jgi:hypothetical protein